jgi:hypothetical protein
VLPMPDSFDDLGRLLHDFGRHFDTWGGKHLETWGPLLVALIALAGGLVTNRRTLKASALQTWQQIRAADERHREQLQAQEVQHQSALSAAEWRQREQANAAEAQHRDQREDAYRADVRVALAEVLGAVRGILLEAASWRPWKLTATRPFPKIAGPHRRSSRRAST